VIAKVRTNPRLVLASGSPRRRELLTEAGFEFEVIAPSVAEVADSGLTLRERTVANATRKALAVGRGRVGCLVLAADTLVELDGEVIGKPADLDHAKKILCRLSGRTHRVCSAVFICEGSRTTVFHDISRVRFRRLSASRICDYLQQVDPLDKAGAYAAQDRSGQIIAQIEGSFTNVVGLPMEKTIVALRMFGIEPRRS